MNLSSVQYSLICRVTSRVSTEEATERWTKLRDGLRYGKDLGSGFS